ncbi:MAG: 30S ribosomal protein S6 [Candidatus Zixiibacteriota bacterium]
MKVYETTFILSPQADDATFDRQIKSVIDLINRHKGKMLHEDRWGIRRMAYPIMKFNQGYYTRLVFEANNDVLTELERFFRLEEPYIRHLTVLFEDDLNAPRESRFFDKNEKQDERPAESAPIQKERPSIAKPDADDMLDDEDDDFSDDDEPEKN